MSHTSSSVTKKLRPQPLPGSVCVHEYAQCLHVCIYACPAVPPSLAGAAHLDTVWVCEAFALPKAVWSSGGAARRPPSVDIIDISAAVLRPCLSDVVVSNPCCVLRRFIVPPLLRYYAHLLAWAAVI